MGCDDDGGGDCSAKDYDDREDCSGRLDSVPHDCLRERWPEEKEEEHGALTDHHRLVLHSVSIVGLMEIVTYEDCSCVDSSEDSETSDADDVIVKQGGTGLISRNGVLKLEISGMWCDALSWVRYGREDIPVQGVCSHALSYDGKDHS